MTKKDFCKVGDFGVSSVLKRTEDRAQSIAGTPYYLAPELYLDQPYQFAADIWSLGVMLYEMCALQYPFNSVDGTQRALAKEVLKNTPERIPSCFSEELNSLIMFMLDKEDSKRPSINNILKYPLIKERIPELISTDTFKEEFSHTVLHGRDVFKEKKDAKKSGKGLVKESDVKASYQPKNGLEVGKFDEAFKAYVDHLNDENNLKKPKNP